MIPANVAHLVIRHSLINLIQLRLAELDVKGCNVFLQILDLLGPRDGEDIVPLVVHPSQSQLP